MKVEPLWNNPLMSPEKAAGRVETMELTDLELGLSREYKEQYLVGCSGSTPDSVLYLAWTIESLLTGPDPVLIFRWSGGCSARHDAKSLARRP